MKIENVTLETKVVYGDSDDIKADYLGRTKDVLEITIMLPGGKAVYEIPLLNGQKESLEYAAKLANEGK